MMTYTEEQRGILKEIGNIGGGNALTSLSLMLDQPLDLNMPECHFVSKSEVGQLLTDPDALYAGVKLEMTGSVDCMLALLMNREFTHLVIKTLDSGEPDFNVEALTPMQKSALCEVGNIMGNSYISAISALFDIHIDVSVPSFTVDTGLRVLREFINGRLANGDRLLFANSSFTTEDKQLESSMLLCASNETVAMIFEKAGL